MGTAGLDHIADLLYAAAAQMDLPGVLDLPTWQKAAEFDLDRDKLLSATRAFRALTVDDAQYLYTRARVRGEIADDTF